MTEYFSASAPIWLWLFAAGALAITAGTIGALAMYCLKLASRLDRISDYEARAAVKVDVERDIFDLRRRLERLERLEPKPIVARPEPPPSFEPIEISDDGDTLPGKPWFTRSRA